MNPKSARMHPQGRVFRRQFLITVEPHDHLSGWQRRVFAGHHVHAHPELGMTVHEAADVDLMLLGFALDPRNPEADDAAVLAGLARHPLGSDAWHNEFDELSGRFVLLAREGDELYAFPDPNALRRMAYMKDERGFAAASDPALLGTVRTLSDEGRTELYADSRQFFGNEEHWIPANVTLYPAVSRLVANHVLTVSTLTQRRFWPNGPVPVSDDPSATAREVGRMLAASIDAAAHRFSLSLPLTAGLDSRTLLAACGDHAADLDLYTLVYRDLVPSSVDIDIARQITAGRGLRYRTISCRQPLSDEWAQAFLAHSTMAHLRDIGRIIEGTSLGADPERVVLNGTVAEAARFFFAREGRPPVITSADDLVAMVDGWSQLPFAREAVATWYDGIAGQAREYGYDLSSLFYWEHRSGGWQAQSQLEQDMVHESFTPFSNRRILARMLGVEESLRLGPDYAFLYEILTSLADWSMNWPVNAFSRADGVRRFLWRAKRKLLRPSVARRRREDIRAAIA